jgi:hypothetical protein
VLAPALLAVLTAVGLLGNGTQAAFSHLLRATHQLIDPSGANTQVLTLSAGGRHGPAGGHDGRPAHKNVERPGAGGGANPDCTLIVPADPLSARGLATPYQLVATNPAQGPCHEADAGQSAFVQGAIITAGGALTLYDPLVVDAGTRPVTTPSPARVPPGATVALWFGSNGDTLRLRATRGGAPLTRAACVNGLSGSPFGQFAYCNAPAFFRTAHAAIAAHRLTVPTPGTARDGRPCPTVRDFSLVDQDQSDNVDTHYLASPRGRTGPHNRATMAALGAGARDLGNGSDNRLLTEFVLPALGCPVWQLPNGADDGTPTASMPLQELQAAAHQAAPVALAPVNDPMTRVDGRASVRKTTLYRQGVDQPALSAAEQDGGAAYCRELFTGGSGIGRVFADRDLLRSAPAPGTGASDLFTFLAARAQGSFDSLGCGSLLKSPNPVGLTLTGEVVTDATLTAEPAH